MIRKRIKFIILLSILVFTFYSLFVEPEILSLQLSKTYNIPLGSFISWSAIVTYTLLIHNFISNSTKSLLSKIITISSRVNLIIALMWLPVTFGLSGNLAFNFQNKPLAYKIWIGYTLLLIIIPILILLLNSIGKKLK